MTALRSFVLDASAALRLAQDEAGTPAARDAFQALLEAGFEATAPDLFAYEAGNAASRGPPARSPKAALLLRLLQTPQFVQLTPGALVRAHAIAIESGLSFYDASYVALAEGAETLVWTEDARILRKFPDRAASTKDIVARLR